MGAGYARAAKRNTFGAWGGECSAGSGYGVGGLSSTLLNEFQSNVDLKCCSPSRKNWQGLMSICIQTYHLGSLTLFHDSVSLLVDTH